MKNSGYTMLLDSIVAMTIVSVIFASLLGFNYSKSTKTQITSFKNLHYLTEDILETLNKQGILDEIGTAWAESDTNRSMEITEYYLNEMVPNSIGYRLTIEDELISESTGFSIEEASDITHSSRLLVGYGKGLPVLGNVARAFLTGVKDKSTSSYAYFGGFVGEGNITRIVRDIPGDANITNISLELSVGSNFDLAINGIHCDNYIRQDNT